MDIVVGGARRVLLSMWVCDLMRGKKQTTTTTTKKGGVAELQGDPDQLYHVLTFFNLCLKPLFTEM